MRLRTAIKIQRHIEGTDERMFRRPRFKWRPETIWKSRTICRRKWRDGRVPYIPDDEELDELRQDFCLALADVLIEEEEELSDFKNQLWEKVGEAKERMQL